jgi:hypothetical protein
MVATRRKFTLEFKTEAAHRVIEYGQVGDRRGRRAVVDKGSLARWGSDEMRNYIAPRKANFPDFRQHPRRLTSLDKAIERASRAAPPQPYRCRPKASEGPSPARGKKGLKMAIDGAWSKQDRGRMARSKMMDQYCRN